MKNFFLKNIKNIVLVVFLLAVGFLSRLLDLPPNFSPIASIALFSGFYFKKKLSFVLPIAILFMSDLVLGFYQWQVMLAVYLSFVAILFIGRLIKKKTNTKLLFASLFGAVIFFLVTNFSVWFFTPWYAKTFEGLILCYSLALPFFRNTLLGNLFFGFLIFGVYDFCVHFTRLRIYKSLQIYELK